MSNTTRVELRTEIELTRERFHRFLVTVPDAALKLSSKDPAWNNGELLYWLSISPRIIKSVLKKYMSERPRHSYISRLITGPLLQKTSEMFIRSRGHNSTRWTIAMQYDNTYTLVMELLDTISDDEFDKTLTVPDIDPLLPEKITIENLFHYVKNHFEFHSKLIELGEDV